MGSGWACANCAAPAGADDPPTCCDFRNPRYFPGAPTDFYGLRPSLAIFAKATRPVPIGVRRKDAAAWRHMAGECYYERCRYCAPHRSVKED